MSADSTHRRRHISNGILCAVFAVTKARQESSERPNAYLMLGVQFAMIGYRGKSNGFTYPIGPILKRKATKLFQKLEEELETPLSFILLKCLWE